MTRFNARRYLLKGPEIPGPLAASTAHYFPDIEFRPVQTKDEMLAAAGIVYQEYLQQGYVRPNPHSLKLSAHHMLPTTVTFVAKHKTEGILATMTAIEDTPFGLPMDALYHLELQDMRHAGRRIFEVSTLASDRQKLEGATLALSSSARTVLVFHLIRAMFDYARLRGLDTLVECCHPKHDGFYKSLDLTPFGTLRSHHGVQGSPAVARVLKLDDALQMGAAHTCTRLFMGDLPARAAAPRPLRLNESDLEDIFVQQTSLLASASVERLKHLQAAYPDANIHQLAAKRSLLDYLVNALEDRQQSSRVAP